MTVTFRDHLIDAIPALTIFARSLTNNRTEAEDLLQDTLERALVKQGLYVETGSMVGWLRVMMHNLFVGRVRSSARRNDIERVALDAAESRSAVPSSQEDHRFLTELQPLLTRLPKDGGEIIAAIALKGDSFDQTAARYDVPVGTIRSRLWRSRERLSRAALLSQTEQQTARTPGERLPNA